jgi:hypothetical protein
MERHCVSVGPVCFGLESMEKRIVEGVGVVAGGLERTMRIL